MARTQNKLTHTQVKNIKPGEKAQKLFDGGGLFLLVTPEGGKYWRMKYRHGGKEKLLALGVYPDVKLPGARDGRKKARAQLQAGQDPRMAEKEEKRVQKMQARNTFEVLAREWHEQQKHRWTPKHSHQVIQSLEASVFPELGERPVAEITPAELLDVLRVVEKRGTLEVAARVLQRCGAVFRYAIATSCAKLNPAADLKGALKAPVAGHYAALEAKELPELMKALDKFPGEKISELATRLLLLTFVRTGELIGAEWQEFDLTAAIWRIPGHRMKMKNDHLVPLSSQALAVLEELKPITGRYALLFPGRRDFHRPMSNVTILHGIERMGFKGRTTGHGFRTTASTVLNEMGFNPDAIERQLAHTEKDSVRAAYNRAEYLKDRRELMQAWGDYLATMRKDPGKVVTLRKARRA